MKIKTAPERTASKTSQKKSASPTNLNPVAAEIEVALSEALVSEVPVPEAEQTPPEDLSTRIARLFLEDYVVTSLLRMGRPLKSTELAASAEGFQLPRTGLRDGLHGSRYIMPGEREWDLVIRSSRKHQSREERARQPLQSSLDELLRDIGKPLPVPVLVRELAVIRGVYPEALRNSVPGVLRMARSALEVREGSWLHRSLILDAAMPSEAVIIRENGLEADPDFAWCRTREWPREGSTLAERAAAILRAAARPLSQKIVGFLLWQQNEGRLDVSELARSMADRSVFHPMLGGLITLQAQVPQWRGMLQSWMQNLSGMGAHNIDVAALLRQRVVADSTLAPRPEDIEDLKKLARQINGHPVSVVSAVTDMLELEPDDPRFVPTLQGLNDALRRSPEFLPAGLGRFLLREAVPAHVGEVVAELRPVQLSVHGTETAEPFDIEMSDEGVEGDCAEFIHAPQWEDVNEEVEVKLPRRLGAEEVMATRYVLLNHHYRAGTMKLRRMDEDFFSLEGALARLSMRAHDDEGATEISAWASRESGLIYGLGDWLRPHAPQSGGVLELSRDAAAPGTIQLKLGAPDKLTFLSEARIAELEVLREASTYLSLFELLQRSMTEHAQGAELPTLWAEINVVRRTTKRLICSVLSAYHCFYFKQRGPKQMLWRFDAGKLDQGFKRNKRKYVRR